MKRVLTYTESYVKEMYTSIGILEPHQLDFRTIAERLGIKVFYWDDSSQALFSNGKSYIVLNEQKSPQQQFQTFCHELAHVLLHVGSQSKLPKLFMEYQEHKANQFMYQAAIPTFMLDQLDHITISMVQTLFNVEYDFAAKRMQRYTNNKIFIPFWNSYNITSNDEIHTYH